MSAAYVVNYVLTIATLVSVVSLLLMFIAVRREWGWPVRAVLLLPFAGSCVFLGGFFAYKIKIWEAFVIALLASPLLLVIFIAMRKEWRWQVRAVLALLLAGGYTFQVGLPAYRLYVMESQQEATEKTYKAERTAYREEAYAYFHKKCAEDSGRFIYKTVTEPQESVYMMKPRKKPTSEELRNQFWMGDPYAGVYIVEMRELSGLLKRKLKTTEGEAPLLSFVETHDLANPERLWRYYPTDYSNPSDTCPRGEKYFKCEAAESIQSRYGFTWDDLSTREDRHYWVAKSRLQIIDLQTQEVIAERIGYFIEKGFGFVNTYGHERNPWQDTHSSSLDSNFCPSKRSTSDEDWIRSVLSNLPFYQ